MAIVLLMVCYANYLLCQNVLNLIYEAPIFNELKLNNEVKHLMLKFNIFFENEILFKKKFP